MKFVELQKQKLAKRFEMNHSGSGTVNIQAISVGFQDSNQLPRLQSAWIDSIPPGVTPLNLNVNVEYNSGFINCNS